MCPKSSQKIKRYFLLILPQSMDEKYQCWEVWIKYLSLSLPVCLFHPPASLVSNGKSYNRRFRGTTIWGNLCGKPAEMALKSQVELWQNHQTKTGSLTNGSVIGWTWHCRGNKKTNWKEVDQLSHQNGSAWRPAKFEISIHWMVQSSFHNLCRPVELEFYQELELNSMVIYLRPRYSIKYTQNCNQLY